MKKFLFFIALIVLFGFSYEVNASSVASIQSIATSNGYLPIFNETYNNIVFTSGQVNGYFSKPINITYYTSHLNGIYDVNFIYRGSGTKSIIAAIDESACEVNPISNYNVSYNSNPSSLSWFYNVICHDVPIYNTDLTIYITQQIDNGNTGSNYLVGSSKLNIDAEFDTMYKAIQSIVNNTNGISDSIDKQTQQQHEDSQKEQEAVNNVNDTLNDSSVDSDAIGSVGSNLPGTNGVLSSILNMPVTFFSNLLNSLDSNSCPNLSFPIPFMDTQASIPCFRSIINDLGALSWFEGIGGLVGGLLIFTYCIHLGKTFNKMSDLDDTNNESWGGL